MWHVRQAVSLCDWCSHLRVNWCTEHRLYDYGFYEARAHKWPFCTNFIDRPWNDFMRRQSSPSWTSNGCPERFPMMLHSCDSVMDLIRPWRQRQLVLARHCSCNILRAGWQSCIIPNNGLYLKPVTYKTSTWEDSCDETGPPLISKQKGLHPSLILCVVSECMWPGCTYQQHEHAWTASALVIDTIMSSCLFTGDGCNINSLASHHVLPMSGTIVIIATALMPLHSRAHPQRMTAFLRSVGLQVLATTLDSAWHPSVCRVCTAHKLRWRSASLTKLASMHNYMINIKLTQRAYMLWS